MTKVAFYTGLADFIGTYAYYLRKVWVHALSAEGPLNSTRLI